MAANRIAWSDRRKAEFKAMYERGTPPAEIAAHFGITLNAVFRRRYNMGLTPQPMKVTPRPSRPARQPGGGIDAVIRAMASGASRTVGRVQSVSERLSHSGRPPLAPGAAWDMITRGTILEGADYG